MPNPDGTPTEWELFQAKLAAGAQAGGSMLSGVPAGAPTTPVGGTNIPLLGNTGLPSKAPVAPPQAPIGPPADQVPTQPDVPAGTESSNQANEAFDAESAFKNAFLGPPSLGGAPTPGIIPGRSDFSALGGAKGEANYDEIEAGRVRTNAAIDAQGQAQQDLGDAKASFYKNQQLSDQDQLATIQKNREDRQAEIQAAQQRLEAGMQNYSNQLADNGQTWHSPMNIMSAIGFALMALGGKDPSVAQKVMNDAVNADFMRRKSLADMHLGELRSNVAMYRQIAGDKDLGDQWALAESHRIAGMEAARISAQAQGPLMKAQGLALKESENATSNMLKMKIYAEMVNHQAAPEQFIGQKAELQAQEAAMPPGVGPTPYKGSWAAGAVKPGLPNVSVNSGGGGSGASRPPNITAALSTLTGQKSGRRIVPQSTKDQFNSRAPGSGERLQQAVDDAYNEAYISAGRAGIADPNKREQYVSTKVNGYIKESTDLANLATTQKIYDARSWGNMATDLKRIRAAASVAYPGDPAGPDKFLGSLRDLTGSKWATYINGIREKYGSRDTPEAKQAMENLAASERFHQMFATKTLGYYHDNLGGAMSEQELELARGVISPTSNFAQIEGFTDIGAKRAGAQWESLLNTASSPAALLVRAKFGLSSPRIDSRGSK